MPSTYSPNLRIELIANGEQSGTWGTTTNNNLGTLIETAISGHSSVAIAASSQALTALNGAADESRNQVIELTGATGAFSVYIPPAEKTYIFYNHTNYDATIRVGNDLNSTSAKSGSNSLTLPKDQIFAIWCDGTKIYVSSNYASITGGSISGVTITNITDLAIADGGTGASTAAGARANLELGSMALQYNNAVNILGGSISGLTTDLAVADGGTGASTAAGARTNLGLGTISTQNSNAVTITGGQITDIVDLAVADGGTGTSTLTGIVKGNGTSPFSAASATDITGAIGAEPVQQATSAGTATYIAGGASNRIPYNTGPGVTAFLSAPSAPNQSLTYNGTAIGWTKVDLASGVTGNLPVTNLNSGTNADNTRFWRGDGVWEVPSGSGNVNGPVTSTDNAIARFSGSGGTVIKNSSVTISDAGLVTASNFAGGGASINNLNPTNLSSAVPTNKGGTGLTAIGTANQLLAVNSGATGLTWVNAPTTMVYPGAGIPLSSGSAWSTSFNNTTNPISVAYGGTGAIDAATARSNLGAGTVTQVNAGNGMSFTNFTTSGTITMGTPSTLSTSSTNSVSSTSHSHAVTFPNTITSVNGSSSGAITTLNLGSAVNTTSGTSVTIPGIPSTAKRVTLTFNGVSLSGSGGAITLSLGTASGIENTGYEGSTIKMLSTVTNIGSGSSFFCYYSGSSASDILCGAITLTLIGSNIWAGTGNISTGNGQNVMYVFAGIKGLSGSLSQLQLNALNGPSFDSGSVNILYE